MGKGRQDHHGDGERGARAGGAEPEAEDNPKIDSVTFRVGDAGHVVVSAPHGALENARIEANAQQGSSGHGTAQSRCGGVQSRSEEEGTSTVKLVGGTNEARDRDGHQGSQH